MTHGHLYGAKQGLYGLSLQVEQHPADLVLYGHTHTPKWEEYDGCLYLCPGSIGYNEERYVAITLKDGKKIDFSFRQL